MTNYNQYSKSGADPETLGWGGGGYFFSMAWGPRAALRPPAGPGQSPGGGPGGEAPGSS